MEKQEFDSLVGIRTDPNCYARIHEVYMDCDAVKDKQHLARIYTKHDMNGIESIYHTIKGHAAPEVMEHAARCLRA